MAKILAVFFGLFVLANAQNEVRQRHPDVGLNVKLLIRKYGYPLQTHQVITDDGYILELHRIPYGKNNTASEDKPVALLFPGVFCSSADWVSMGPKKGLGFILADKGYDVWLANYRGTTWSRKHVTLNPDEDKKKFWNYSFQEIGEYDLAATIDHIRNVTKQEKLFYIGHSQGTTSSFALFSEKPEYNDKVRLAIELAPVAYANHMKTPFLYLLAIFREQVEEFVEKNQFYEVLPHSRLFTIIGQLFCNDDSPFQDLCAAVFYIAAGYTPDQLNKTMIPVIVSSTPAGASVQQFQHYAQLLLSRSFQKYDYGEEENIARYGSAAPPKYDLSKVTVPVALYYGSKDLMSTPKDIDRVASELSNVVAKQLIDGFSHLDYLWGIDAVEFLYNGLLDLMERY